MPNSVFAGRVSTTGTVTDGQIAVFDGTTGLFIKGGSGGGTGYVSSITGTANQITASAATGAVTLSMPSTFIAPGSIAATTTVSGTVGIFTTSIISPAWIPAGGTAAVTGDLTATSSIASPVGVFGTGTFPSSGAVRLVNDTYVTSRTTGGANRNLIGLNSSNLVRIDDSGAGASFGGAATVTGALTGSSTIRANTGFNFNGTAGFTGTGIYTTLTIQGGIITNAV